MLNKCCYLSSFIFSCTWLCRNLATEYRAPEIVSYLYSLVLALDLNAKCQGEVGMWGAPGVRVLPADLHVPRICHWLQLQVLGWVWFDWGSRETSFIFLMGLCIMVVLVSDPIFTLDQRGVHRIVT